MFHLPLLNDELFFPPLENAHSSGLLAAGGDLSIHRLILAYSSGIFPWFDAHDPFLWWSPDPRFVLFTKDFKLSKRQERAMRQSNFYITANTVFSDVIEYCAHIPRKKITSQEDNLGENLDTDLIGNCEGDFGENSDKILNDNLDESPKNNLENSDATSNTWITPDMIQAYKDLFEEGFAHSVEVWQEYKEGCVKDSPHYKADTHPIFMMKDRRKYQLVGGLYGIRMGHIFCGESMFHLVPEASRAALAFLINAMEKHNMPLLDSQQKTPHIERMGGKNIARKKYLQILHEGLHLHGTAHAHPFLT